jgi:hypothetical protein
MLGCLRTANFSIVSMTESGSLRAADRISSGSGGVRRRRCRVLPHNYPVYAYSFGPLDTPKSGARRASSSAQSQCRCRSRERILHDAGQLAARHGLTGLTVEEVAHDAGVSRLTVYHHFDSPGRLLEALAWSVLERADIGRVRQARMHPDPSKALREFVAANAPFLATLGAQGRAVLATGLADPDVRAVI